jgi:hypothetical protein
VNRRKPRANQVGGRPGSAKEELRDGCRSFDRQVATASAAVQTDMNLTRRALAVRPAASQEP